MANPKEAARQGIEFFNQGKLDEWIKEVAEDAELVTPLGGTITGRDGIKGYFLRTREGFPDARVNVQRLIAEGNVVVVEYTFTGTNTGPTYQSTGETIPATNRTLNSPALDIGTYDSNGTLKSLHQYFDAAGALQQLGLMPAPAAARS
jgi:steroid delta-isomerase-like uncharacterized protein